MTAIHSTTPRHVPELPNLPDSPARVAAFDGYTAARNTLDRVQKNPEARPEALDQAKAAHFEARKNWVAFSAEAKGQDPKKAVAALEASEQEVAALVERLKGLSRID